MWVGVVVVEGVGEDMVVVIIFGKLVLAGLGIIVVGLELIINLSNSMKSFGLSGAKQTALFSWIKVKSS